MNLRVKLSVPFGVLVMSTAVRFADVVDYADHLSLEEQEELVDIIKSRMRDEKRKRIIDNVQASRKEFEAGKLKPISPEDIINEALA
ncbi:MAG: hypothetical protein HQL32_12725 [Planctomycetes bacterium]|nr:hypothetical protein [Planctomycetota bacterium]